MNIFIKNTPYLISDIEDGNSYYFDNSSKSIIASLPNLSNKVKISLNCLYENENSIYIFTSKGVYILNSSIRELTLIYENYWMSPDETNIIPFYDGNYKQQIKYNIFNYARFGENVIITNNRGNTQSNGRYKISNYVIISCSNYASKDKSSINGMGEVVVFRKSENGTFFDQTISSGYDYFDGEHQGNFGKHVKVLDMGLYDLLAITAPTKVQSESPNLNGYIYIYSNRMNEVNEPYFHLETKIPFPPLGAIKDLSGIIINSYTKYNTVVQLESIPNIGISVLFDSKKLYLYSLSISNGNIQYNISINDLILPNYQKAYPNTQKLYLCSDQNISVLNYSTQSWNSISNPIIQNIYNVKYFGKMLFQYNGGIIVFSQNDFFDYDSSYQLKKRITFQDDIISSDCFINGQIRNYMILTSGNNNNVFVFNQDYELILNQLLKESLNDFPNLIRFDELGETIYLATSNGNNLFQKTSQMGNVNNYDLFFENEFKNIPSLFPDFDIYNQVLIEEKSIDSNQKFYYVEENFEGILPLISNRSNPNKSIEKIYPVVNDPGILLELNDQNVEDGTFLEKYAKYFIYNIPSASSTDNYSTLLNSSNLYLGWIDNQMIQYNTTSEYLIYTYKSNGIVNVVMLSVGNQPNFLYGKRWNIIESKMDSNIDKIVYDVSLNMFGNLVTSEFDKFEKYAFDDQVIFLVRNKFSIVIIDYFERTTVVKTFLRDITDDLFYFDNYKNMFHLYKVNNDIYLTILRKGYNLFILNGQKMDLKKMPSQFFGQYYSNVFVFLENYLQDSQSVIQLRRFDIKQNIYQTIEFEEINISNEFPRNKFILDIDFQTNKVSKIYISNNSDKNNKIFQKNSNKFYSLPTLNKTKFTSYNKNYIRQVKVNENNFVNYEQYKIEDVIPDVFFNKLYQKYFSNNLGMYADYKFVDLRNITSFDASKNIVVAKQNERSFSKYIIKPETGYQISTFVFDSSSGYLALTEKGLTGSKSNVKIYNVNKNKYDLQKDGIVSGILVQNLHFDKEICYETLDVNENTNEFYVSEEYDVSNSQIGYWLFNFSNLYLPSRYFITTSTVSTGCFYRTRTGEFVSNTLINNTIPYFTISNNTNTIKYISLPNSIQIQPLYDIKIISEQFFSLVDGNNTYLFIRNSNYVNKWSYFAKGIHKIKTSNISYKLLKNYYLDLDISMNDSSTLTETNINIQSIIFSDNKKNFYCVQDNNIFKIEHPILQQLYDYTTFSNDGSTIYSQDISGNNKKLFYFNHANISILSEQVSTPHFCPQLYKSNFHQQIQSKGYFTLTNNELGVSKKYLLGATASNEYQSDKFPLVDYLYSTYMYNNKLMNKFKLDNNTYVLDSSSNISKLTIPIDSSENIIIDNNFNSLSYSEIQFATKMSNFNDFNQDSPTFITLSPDASEFIIYENNNFAFFNERLEKYPSKFTHLKTMTPNNNIKSKLYTLDVPTSFIGDWVNNRILMGFGGLGATGTNRSKIDIVSWNPDTKEISYHSGLTGQNSFGYKILLSDDSEILFVTEPIAPPEGEYKQGKIHFYQYNHLTNQYIYLKTIRSKNTNIGEGIHVSKTMNKLVTYSNQFTESGETGTGPASVVSGKIEFEKNKLVIFSDLFEQDTKEICLEIDTIDAVFIGKTDSLLVQEKVRYNKKIPERKFYIIDDVNGCSNILTRYSLTNTILDDDLTEFKMIPFGFNYILLEGINVYHIMKIEENQLKYIASQNKPENSVVSLNQLGNTIMNLQKANGSLIITLTW